MQHRNKKTQKQNVTKINNEYTRTNDEQKKARRKAKFYVKRRLFILITITLVLLSGIMMNTMAKKDELAERKVVEERVVKELEQVKLEQERLQTQVRKLQDDEYILKLARKEYFLSDDGEIIFTMPTEHEQSEKDNEKGSEE